MAGTAGGEVDDVVRCDWADSSDAMRAYHDREWGVPSHDDLHLFEMLTLEGAQAGLSWSTVLNKRERYREVFAGFDPEAVARFDEARILTLLEDPGIIRNRLKVRGTVSNARSFLAVAEEFGSFATYLWSAVDDIPVVHRPRSTADLPAHTEALGPCGQGPEASGVHLRGLDHRLLVPPGRGRRGRPPGVLLRQTLVAVAGPRRARRAESGRPTGAPG